MASDTHGEGGKANAGREAVVSADASSLQPPLGSSSGDHRVGDVGDNRAPSPTLRAKSRLLGQDSHAGRHPASGPLGLTPVRPSLRKSSPCDVAPQADPGQLTSEDAILRDTLGGHPFRYYGKSVRRWRRRALELFSGSGALSKGLRAVGWLADEMDITYGKNSDLNNSTVQNRVLRSIPEYDYVHIGITCASFSTARKGKPGAPGGPLRSRQFPLGLPSLPPKDKYKVTQGNRSMYFIKRVIALCIRLNIPVTLENPYQSWLWRQPTMSTILRSGVANRVSYCAFAAPWRKTTRFHAWGLPSFTDFGDFLCWSPGSRCKFTGKKHKVLEGRNSANIPWTQIAEPYPPKLVDLLVRVISSTVTVDTWQGAVAR